MHFPVLLEQKRKQHASFKKAFTRITQDTFHNKIINSVLKSLCSMSKVSGDGVERRSPRGGFRKERNQLECILEGGRYSKLCIK